MKVLFLGYQNSPLISFLKSVGETVVCVGANKKFNIDFVKRHATLFLSSM